MPDQPTNRSAIFSWISSHTPPNSRVLDIGCGGGELLAKLVEEKDAQARGIELSEKKMMEAVRRGLSVHHGDAHEGLSSYGDQSFDLTVMSLTIQELADPLSVLREAFRVSKKVVVVFPNFGYYPGRLQLAFLGRAPRTKNLPYSWFGSPNRHFVTISDWKEFCKGEGWTILEETYLDDGRTISFLPNLRASVAINLLEATT